MDIYRSPELLSYNHSDIKDVIGPCQAASTNFRITGGWDSAQNILNSNNVKIEYCMKNVKIAKNIVKHSENTIA